MKLKQVSLSMLVSIFAFSAVAQEIKTIDSDAIIQKAISVEAELRMKIKDLVVDAEYIEGKLDDDGNFQEKLKFTKRIYRKIFPDTLWKHEEFLEFYDQGKLASEKEKNKAVKKWKKRKAKTANKHDLMFMLFPFYAENKEKYSFKYLGLNEKKVNGRLCHHFKVEALLEEKSLIHGDYYIEAEGFHLARVTFRPAKLVKKMMFKLHKLDMAIDYSPLTEETWLPQKFEITGKGKAALFFGVNFGGSEIFSNAIINGGIDDSMFEKTRK